MLTTLPKILLIFITVYFTLTLWANRSSLTQNFDPVYWKDKYEHSQWKLPLSVRTLGDDGLYLYEGYRLINGENPTTLNAEVPPLGKYLIGFIIKTTSKPALYGYFTTILAFIIWSLIVRRVSDNHLLSLTFFLLLLTDPLLTNQLTLTMLDSLQLLSLGLFFFSLTFNSPIYLSLTSGLALGLFSQTKAPILSPLLFLLAVICIWIKTKKLHSLTLFLAAAFFAYLLPYLRYFLLGHTLLDWLKVQKWIITFYSQSQLAPNFGSLWTTLMVNQYQNLFTHKFTTVNEWSLAWPIITLSSCLYILKILLHYLRSIIKSNHLILTLLIIFLIITSLIYTLIPFWTRYLILLLPILYLLALLIIQKFPRLISLSIIVIIILTNIYTSLPILFSSPKNTVAQIVYDLRYGFFQDLYEHLSSDSKAKISRTDFHRRGLTLFYQGEIEAVSVDINAPLSGHAPSQQIPLTITYYTRHLGPFTQNANLSLINENNSWKIPWDWQLLIADLTPAASLTTQVNLALRGNIISNDKSLSAADVPGFLVWVTPNQIDKSQEETFLKLLESLFQNRVKAIALHQRLVGNTLGDQPIPLGVIPTPDIIKLQSYPGVTLTPAYFRQYKENNLVTIGTVANTQFFECCSYLYNTTPYSGYDGLEAEKDAILKGENGGSLTIVDQEGKILRTLIQKPKHNSSDVQL